MSKKVLTKILVFFMFILLGASPVFAIDEAELKKELERTEKEIAEQEAILNQQKVKSNQILGEVNKLTTQINKVQKNIDARINMTIILENIM